MAPWKRHSTRLLKPKRPIYRSPSVWLTFPERKLLDLLGPVRCIPRLIDRTQGDPKCCSPPPTPCMSATALPPRPSKPMHHWCAPALAATSPRATPPLVVVWWRSRETPRHPACACRASAWTGSSAFSASVDGVCCVEPMTRHTPRPAPTSLQRRPSRGVTADGHPTSHSQGT